jgi:hypothetical protein
VSDFFNKKVAESLSGFQVGWARVGRRAPGRPTSLSADYCNGRSTALRAGIASQNGGMVCLTNRALAAAAVLSHPPYVPGPGATVCSSERGARVVRKEIIHRSAGVRFRRGMFSIRFSWKPKTKKKDQFDHIKSHGQHPVTKHGGCGL